MIDLNDIQEKYALKREIEKIIMGAFGWHREDDRIIMATEDIFLKVKELIERRDRE